MKQRNTPGGDGRKLITLTRAHEACLWFHGDESYKCKYFKTDWTILSLFGSFFVFQVFTQTNGNKTRDINTTALHL